MGHNEKKESRICITVIIMSDCLYLWYLMKSFNKYLKTRDWRYIFPIIASLFAFLNNMNDIYNFLFFEILDGDCNFFLICFKITALFNWTPISWLQAYRLIIYTKLFYKKKTYYIISAINIILSGAYTISYYLNFIQYTYEDISKKTNRFMFCTVKQKSDVYTLYLMIFDVCDSAFSLGILVFTAYMALDSIQYLRYQYAKIKRMVEEGFIQLIVLTLSKIICYTLIFYLMKNESMVADVIWDILSVIVIGCSYRLVNVRYERVNYRKDDEGYD
ncbi:hypothetical protein BCR32DRAFT_268245 [Anaeromyces robustus]|uniref:G-protein coupled receptors family 1 profile domain-containing protein n=1 Tax=Anaeromyces robustus TaxID=1754192 RepID=A0A1Y1X711_9FUNG|nr:hypothetical protein BCR32DRAFT_268245 [Anaeromyces robustus]|eukprot:ORX81502.1 hypothetical protein BCR32DRAFT_268245 [Anaeromyces robustus]